MVVLVLQLQMTNMCFALCMCLDLLAWGRRQRRSSEIWGTAGPQMIQNTSM